jgi:hypothetical protein
VSRIVPEWVTRANRNKSAGLKHGFRSGLEEKIGKQIEQQGQEVLFETFKVPYVVPQETRRYTPDFLLRNGIIIEGKGIFDATDRAKHLLIKVQYPELDIRFVFTRSLAPIGPGAKSSLADWCRKYGYQFADKLIPASWFAEAGPKKMPEEVLKAGPYGYVSQCSE